MNAQSKAKRVIPSLAAVALSGALAFAAFPAAEPAHAVTAAEKQAEADAVYAQIDSLQTSLNEVMAEYERASSAYDEAVGLRDQAAKDIKKQTERIETLQEDLSAFAVGMYKQGGAGSFLDVVLQATSFEQFLNSWDACKTISSKGTALVGQEKEAREQLEAAKAQYEEQSARAQGEMQTAESSMQQISATQDALRSEAMKLSAEAAELQVQEELAAEAARQAEEARKQQEAAIAAAYEAASGGSDYSSGSSGASSSAGASVLMGSGYFTNPCPSAYSSSGFGYRTFDNSFHKGLDMAAPSGTPYYAADSGTVMYATNDGGYNGGAGNWVVISHGNGIVTKYMHSSATFVSPGDYVTRGQNIGLVGETGAAFGAHLHFQVEVDGVAVNPLNYI